MILCAIGCVARPAFADEPSPPPATFAPAPPAVALRPLPPREDTSQPRVFVSTMVDVGFLYLRPRVAFGYGIPFFQWFGVEANPIASTSYVGGYLGVRGALPWIDLRGGARVMQQIQRSFLAEQEDGHYSRRDAEDRSVDDNADYVELETELSASFDVGPGDLVAVFTATLLLGVPDGQLVFEDTMRVIANAPGFWRARLGYTLAFGPKRALRLGPVFDLIGLPGRDALVLRGGAVVSVKLWPNLEVRASLVPALASPDELGIAGGDFAHLGVRWTWATR